MAIGDIMLGQQSQNPQQPQQGGVDYSGAVLPFQQQQAQEQDPDTQMSQLLQDEGVRDQVAAMLAMEMEPPGSIEEMRPPEPQMPNHQVNPQASQQALEGLLQTRQGTQQGGGNGSQ